MDPEILLLAGIFFALSLVCPSNGVHASRVIFWAGVAISQWLVIVRHLGLPLWRPRCALRTELCLVPMTLLALLVWRFRFG